MFRPSPRQALMRQVARRIARNHADVATRYANVATGIATAESAAVIALALTGASISTPIVLAVIAGTAVGLALLAVAGWHTVEAARVRREAGCARFTRRVFYAGSLAGRDGE